MSSANHLEETDLFTLQDFSIEILLQIFLFSYGIDIRSGVAEMFRTMGLASKGTRDWCDKFIEAFPLSAEFCSDKDLNMVVWMCSKGVKLVNFHSIGRGKRSHLDLRICMHALSSCDISNLQSITVRATEPPEPGGDLFTSPREHEDYEIAIDAGIPVEVVQQPTGGTTDHSVYRYLEDYLPTRAMNLKRLTVSMSMQQEDITLAQTFSVLAALSDRLEELRLEIWMWEFNCHGRDLEPEDIFSAGLQRLGEVIESMPLLKKLHVHTHVYGTMKINSGSLEEIDVTDADFRVNECICPRLRECKCMYLLGALEPTPREEGQMPMPILTIADSIHSMRWPEIYYKKSEVTQKRNRRFQRLEVPDSCLIQWYRRDLSDMY